MSTDPRSRPNVAQIVQLHEEERHLMDYVRMVYKRRWIALPVFLVVVIVGAINSFRTTPIYEARTQLLIEKDLPKVGTLSTMFQEQDTWYNDDFYQTQYRILQSRTLARRAVELMNLPAHPSIIRGLPAETTPLSVMAVLSGAYDWIRQGGSKTPVAAAPAPEPEDRLAPYVNLMLGSLTVAPVRNSRLVELRFTSTDPQLATDMANGLAKAYIEQSLEFRFTASKEATDWLDAQLAEQRKKVEQSEAALQRYTRAERRRRGRRSPEHRRAEAGGPERGGDARQDRPHHEGGAVQTAEVASRDTPGSTACRRFCRTTSSSSRRPSSRTCSGSRRSSLRSSASATRTW